MEKENNNCVPRLRFPGFTGEWKLKKLSDVLTNRRILQRISDAYPLLSFTSDSGVIDGATRNIDRSFLTHDIENKKYLLTKVNDIVYNPANLKFGAIHRNTFKDGVVSPIYVTFETKENPYFIDAIVTSSAFRQEALKFEEGTIVARQAVSPEDLLSMQVYLPSSQEQQKIAEFLSSFDDLIAKQWERVESLKVFKRGLMLQLLPQGVEKCPRLRFPGYVGEWVERTLGEVGNTVSGLTYSPANIAHDGLLVLRSSNIQNGMLCFDDCVYVTSINKYNPVLENDILICVRNGSASLIGKCALIPKGLAATFGAFMMVFRTSEWRFVFQLLKTDRYKKQIEQNLGARINSINSEDFKNYRFLFPPTLAEQQKIAECLSSLDDQIAAESAKLEALRDHKKGLVQQLFPQPEK